MEPLNMDHLLKQQNINNKGIFYTRLLNGGKMKQKLSEKELYNLEGMNSKQAKKIIKKYINQNKASNK